MSGENQPRKRLVIGDARDERRILPLEFRLTYEGRLASGASASAQHKHDIRRVFHEQLKRLWETHPFLRQQEAWWSGNHAAIRRPDDSYRPDKPFLRKEELARAFGRGTYSFVPLILEELHLTCELEILFLRPGMPGEAVNGGDIDNRLKTLLDGLKVPNSILSEPAADEDPFFVLLEDDRLITKLSVETDTLLQPTGPAAGAQDARLIVTVRFSPFDRLWGNMGF